ncbi:MAG: hypothetical protein GX322_03195 [Firmicutes bacterium]|nr:hypothetical protein [Bacillota bacterium]
MDARPIYRLEPGDEMPDVMAVMGKDLEPSVILIDHPLVTVLKNPVNLRLLRDYAREAQRQLIIVSEDPMLPILCHELGIECYGNESELRQTLGTGRQIESTSEADRELEENWSAAPINVEAPLVETTVWRPTLQRWLVLIMAVVAVGLVYYVLTPKVVVTVTPQLFNYQQTVRIAGVSSGGSEHGEDNLPTLPLEPIKAVLETEAIVTATGSQTLGTAFATGVVVFINETDQAVTVPKGTELATGEGVAFKTNAAVTVPGRSTDYFLDVATGVRAGQKEVGITALEKGSQANVTAGRIRLINNSKLNEVLTVRNPEPTGGGASIQQPVVTEEDIEKAKAVCLRQANLQIEEILQNKANQTNSILIVESATLEQRAVEPSVEAGSEAQTLRVLARFEARGQAFRRGDLGEIIQRELERDLPLGIVLYQPKFEVERLTANLEDNAVVLLEADVKAPVHRQILAGEVARLLAGLRRQDVEELSKVLDAESIAIEPDNASYLPRFAHWIKVEVGAPEAVMVDSAFE